MKSVVFNSKAATGRDIYDLKKVVDKFLAQHSGYSEIGQFTFIEKGEIAFKMRCANSFFTRAFALLQLIFSSSDIDSYIRYTENSYNFSLVVGSGSDKCERAIKWIEQHMEVTIS